MPDSSLSRLLDSAKRLLLDRGARPVADEGRRRFFRRAGVAAVGTGLLMPEVARAGVPLDLPPGTVVDARGRPMRNARGDQPYVGEIMLFAGNFTVRGYGMCNGQLIAVSQNDALFSILGTTYGGDGRNTFGLPDLRGRVPVHQGTGPGLSPYRLGSRGGAEMVTWTTDRMPSHTHTQPVLNAPGTLRTPSGNILAGDATNDSIYSPPADANAALAPSNATGSSQPFNIRSPFLAMSFQMSLYGVYPSRN